MELAHAYNHVWRCFKRKGQKESIKTWTNDFPEASVVRMTLQIRG